MRALACPASLKGVLSAPEAAAALAAGLRAGGAEAHELPVADGGEGTAEVLALALGGEWQVADVHDAFGAQRRARWLLLPDRTAVLETAAAIPLDPARLDPFAASSRGFAELVSGAAYVLDAVGFDASAFDLVVTGEGRVDRTTQLGKAPGEVVKRAAGSRCVVFGGVVEEPVPGAETVALSGDPARARDDLRALGRALVLKQH